MHFWTADPIVHCVPPPAPPHPKTRSSAQPIFVSSAGVAFSGAPTVSPGQI